MWLVASAERDDLEAIRSGAPELWREVRRFNAPVQLALAAATDAIAHARRPAEVALVSLAPCDAGSPELHRWVHEVAGGALAARVNPTHTLHAVDNLGLSVLAMRLGAHGWALGLGGASGQLWAGLEAAGERLATHEHEALVYGGDPGGAAALLFAREPVPGTRAIRLAGIERVRVRDLAPPSPHAGAGARAMLAALRGHPPGRLAYAVPPADGDGLDAITVTWELA